MSYLVLKDLCKNYDGKASVLDHINLTIEPGEFIVLVGPSGCGKSTILRLIAGLEQASSGDIYINSRCVNDVAPVQRDIAMVFQDYALYPHMTVAENLSFGLRIRKTSKEQIAKKIAEAARILNIESLLERKPAQLSGGQRQRVAIGRAIVREPSLFLFDEPLSNLDAKLRADMRIDLAALHRRVGKTSVYVTHDQQEAMTLADRIVVLDKGRIQQIGSPMELYEKPANTLVASFIGSPTMNLISGELTSDKQLNNETHFKSATASVHFKDKTVIPPNPGKYILGIRPEDLSVVAANQEATLSNNQAYDTNTYFSGKLLFKELHGHEIQAIVKVGDQNLIARMSSHRASESLAKVNLGDPVKLPLRKEKLHWFNTTADGKRVDTNL